MSTSTTWLADTALLSANFLWYGAGLYQFTIRARPTSLGARQRGNAAGNPANVEHTADIFRYLGAINGALSLSTIPILQQLLRHGTYHQDRTLHYLYGVWGAAHASQAIITLTVVGPSKRWRWNGLGLGLITYIDLALWFFNWYAWWRRMV